MNSQILNQITEEAKTYFQDSVSCHDWDHTQRVLNLAVQIGKKEDANLKVIELAAILHDIARTEEIKSKKAFCHAEKGAEIAKEILKKYNLDNSIIQHISDCIKTHRFRSNLIPQSKEAQIIYDADKLDSIGAIGLGRAFSFAGRVGAKVHNSKEDAENSEEFSSDDTAYRE
jgi:uncharacterized protein